MSCYREAAKRGLNAAETRMQQLQKRLVLPKLTIRSRTFEVEFPYASKGCRTLALNSVFLQTALTDDEWKSIVDFVIKNEVEVLWLRSNRITDIPPGLGWENAKLQVIDLYGNIIQTLPRDFAAQRNLQYLSLANNPLNEEAADVIIEVLANSPYLRQLFIGRWRLLKPGSV